MSKEKQIEKKACKNCIHFQMCVDTFRKAKQDGEILLIEEDAYFADANGCDFYADKRIYRKQSEVVKAFAKRFEKYIGNCTFTLGQVNDIQYALRMATEDMKGGDNNEHTD